MAEFSEYQTGDTVEFRRENISGPAMRVSNASSGVGIEVDKLVATSTASIATIEASNLDFTGALLDIDAVASDGLTFTSSASAGTPLTITRGVLASPTVAALELSAASTPSAPVFEFSDKAFVSVSTIKFITGVAADAGVVGAKVGNNYYWIPLLPAGTVTGIAW